MNETKIVFLSSQLSERGRWFIEEKLKDSGYGDLKAAHGDLFRCLFVKSPQCAKDLVEKTGRSKSTVSELVDKLTRLGYLTKSKDTSDARSVLVGLTEKGKKFESVFEKISAELSEKIVDGMSSEELSMAETVLKKLISRF